VIACRISGDMCSEVNNARARVAHISFSSCICSSLIAPSQRAPPDTAPLVVFHHLWNHSQPQSQYTARSPAVPGALRYTVTSSPRYDRSIICDEATPKRSYLDGSRAPDHVLYNKRQMRDRGVGPAMEPCTYVIACPRVSCLIHGRPFRQP
jgi:hypothetical protein